MTENGLKLHEVVKITVKGLKLRTIYIGVGGLPFWSCIKMYPGLVLVYVVVLSN